MVGTVSLTGEGGGGDVFWLFLQHGDSAMQDQLPGLLLSSTIKLCGRLDPGWALHTRRGEHGRRQTHFPLLLGSSTMNLASRI